jgi:uncharacterized delta-60 repeat protein
LTIQPDGKLVTAGELQVQVGQAGLFRLIRYNRDGSLDGSFGSAGTVTTPFDQASARAEGVVLQSDGRIVAAGSLLQQTGSQGGESAVVRYNADGSLDSTFGAGGKVVTDPDCSGRSGVNAIALQADNKIVTAGSTRNMLCGPDGAGLAFAVYRYQAAPQASNAIAFSASAFSANEGCTTVSVSLSRTGDTSAPATVDFATYDATANQKRDYTLGAGTVSFAAGQATQTFNVLLTENSYTTGNVTLTMALSNPGGSTLTTPSVASLTINDNDHLNLLPDNPIDDPQTFVCEHYHDLLARPPDAGGAAFWTGQLTACGTNQQCINMQRTNVSDAFFAATEYQNRAAFVYRVYQAALGTRPTYLQFMPDRSRLAGGSDLEAIKTAFLNDFMSRPAFLFQYPVTMTADAYVNKLNANTGNSLTQQEMEALVLGLQNGTENRETVLRQVVENPVFTDRQYNSAFVATLYFGYLRRDPEPGGFDFWLDKINQFPLRDVNGRRRQVCAFTTANEFLHRFGGQATHSNAECGS